jgi:hypothetical protein
VGSGSEAGVDNVLKQKKTEGRKMLACTVPQAQVKMRHAKRPTRPLHAMFGIRYAKNLYTYRFAWHTNDEW